MLGGCQGIAQILKVFHTLGRTPYTWFAGGGTGAVEKNTPQPSRNQAAQEDQQVWGNQAGPLLQSSTPISLAGIGRSLFLLAAISFPGSISLPNEAVFLF